MPEAPLTEMVTRQTAGSRDRVMDSAAAYLSMAEALILRTALLQRTPDREGMGGIAFSFFAPREWEKAAQSSI